MRSGRKDYNQNKQSATSAHPPSREEGTLYLAKSASGHQVSLLNCNPDSPKRKDEAEDLTIPQQQITQSPRKESMLGDPTSEPARHTRGGRLPADPASRQLSPHKGLQKSDENAQGSPESFQFAQQSTPQIASQFGSSTLEPKLTMTKRKVADDGEGSSEHKKSQGKRKYVCSHAACGKSFTTSGHLARHFRIHTGEKAYACPLPGCPSRFSRQDNMIQHYRTHMGHGQTAGGELEAMPRPSTSRTRQAAAPPSSTSTSSPGSRAWPTMAGPSTTGTTMNPPGQQQRLSVPVTGPSGQYGTVGYRSTALPVAPYGYPHQAAMVPGTASFSPFAPSPLPMQPGGPTYSIGQAVGPGGEHQQFEGGLNNPLAMASQAPMFPFTPVERRDHPGQPQAFLQQYGGRYNGQPEGTARPPAPANGNGIHNYKNMFPINESTSENVKTDNEPSGATSKSPTTPNEVTRSPEKISPVAKESKDKQEGEAATGEGERESKESLEHSRSNSGLDSLAEAVASYA